MKDSYIEWISENKIGFITNCFNRILYVNREWPNGNYEKFTTPMRNGVLAKTIKEKCKKGRTFTKEELMLELL